LAVPVTVRHRARITGPRRAHLDTTALARLLADLAAHAEADPPEAHPTLIRLDRTGKNERN
jgi:hypothetical protein